jgi:hypothetical protein
MVKIYYYSMFRVTRSLDKLDFNNPSPLMRERVG